MRNLQVQLGRTRYISLGPQKYRKTNITQLSQQVEQDEDGGEEASTVPGGVDVLVLLPPLKPHPDPVLQEGADQAEPGHVGQVVLGDPQELQGERRSVLLCGSVSSETVATNNQSGHNRK